MINKKTFLEIIDRLKATNETVDSINTILRNCRDTVEADFTQGSSLMICHEDLVVRLLDNMFDTDMISWWIFEESYGREFKIGDLEYEENGRIVAPDLSSAEKLYDYLTIGKTEEE